MPQLFITAPPLASSTCSVDQYASLVAILALDSSAIIYYVYSNNYNNSYYYTLLLCGYNSIVHGLHKPS